MLDLVPFLLFLAAPPDVTIRHPVFDSTLVIHQSARTAGAIDSLKFRGKEFVNAYDHGREWQSAVSYDGLGECLNPTEAGSNPDAAGPDTSSELLDVHKNDTTLFTTVKMAYWLKPGDSYKGACGTRKDIHDAQNKSVLSDDTIIKQVTIGYNNIPNVIEFLVILNVAEPHQSIVFEAVTGYMPAEFSQFLTFDPATSKITPLTAGPGEQNLPLILSTKDRKFAVGIYSPDSPQYGRFLFLDQPKTPGWNTAKWNCVFRGGETKPGPILHRCLVAVGTVDEVSKALQQLLQ